MWMSLWIGVLVGFGLTGSVLAEVVAVEVHGGVRERVGVLCEFALPAFKGATLPTSPDRNPKAAHFSDQSYAIKDF